MEWQEKILRNEDEGIGEQKESTVEKMKKRWLKWFGRVTSIKLLPLPWEFHGNPMGWEFPFPMHTSTVERGCKISRFLGFVFLGF